MNLPSTTLVTGVLRQWPAVATQEGATSTPGHRREQEEQEEQEEEQEGGREEEREAVPGGSHT